MQLIVYKRQEQITTSRYILTSTLASVEKRVLFIKFTVITVDCYSILYF